MRHAWRGCVTLLGAAVLAVGPWSTVTGQRVTGRVVRPHGDHPEPVPRAWVVLHRIAHDTAGPIDSMRTDARGAYDFSYRRTEEDSALYLASSMRGGVAYFTPPLRPGVVRGEAAEIMVFDTTSARLPLRVQGRHFVIATPAADGDKPYEVLEVYELSNDTSLTAVAGPAGRAVWTARVPAGARRFRIAQGDVSDGGLLLRDGRAQLFAPVAPGLKQLSFRYELPRDAFPLTLPITDAVGILEVVADDPGARVSGAGLRETRAMASEGRTFKRFLSQDVPANAVVRIDLSRDDEAARGAMVVTLGALFAAASAGALLFAFTRDRSRSAAAATAGVQPKSGDLVRAIAELDDRFEREAPNADSRRASYEAERGLLKERLRAVLARDPDPA